MGLDHSRANTTCLAQGCVQSPGDPVAPAGSGVLPISDCECAEWEACLDGCKCYLPLWCASQLKLFGVVNLGNKRNRSCLEWCLHSQQLAVCHNHHTLWQFGVPLIFSILIFLLLSHCAVGMSFCSCFYRIIYCLFRFASLSMDHSQLCFFFILCPSLSEDFQESSPCTPFHGLAERLSKAW